MVRPCLKEGKKRINPKLFVIFFHTPKKMTLKQKGLVTEMFVVVYLLGRSQF
jgi:hypothetical protein